MQLDQPYRLGVRAPDAISSDEYGRSAFELGQASHAGELQCQATRPKLEVPGTCDCAGQAQRKPQREAIAEQGEQRQAEQARADAVLHQ